MVDLCAYQVSSTALVSHGPTTSHFNWIQFLLHFLRVEWLNGLCLVRRERCFLHRFLLYCLMIVTANVAVVLWAQWYNCFDTVRPHKLSENLQFIHSISWMKTLIQSLNVVLTSTERPMEIISFWHYRNQASSQMLNTIKCSFWNFTFSSFFLHLLMNNIMTLNHLHLSDRTMNKWTHLLWWMNANTGIDKMMSSNKLNGSIQSIQCYVKGTKGICKEKYK